MRLPTRHCLILALLPACLPALTAERDPRTGERLMPVEIIESLALPASGAAALRITYPAVRRPFPVIVLSQGARSAPAMYESLARHWAARGHVVLQPLPPELSPIAADPQDRSAVRLPPTIQARIGDIRFTLGHLGELEARTSTLRGRLDHERIALAGHSIGALASLLAAGPHLVPLDGAAADHATAGSSATAPRIDAVILIGDPARSGIVPDGAWRTLDVPTLLVTGNLDEGEGPPGDRKAETLFAMRQSGAASLTELFVRGMDVCLGGLLCRMPPGTTPDPAAQAAIAEVSSAFLQVSLRRDADAAKWLADDAPADLANGRATWKAHR
jgi:predicted dienelactone hydrolase